MSLTLTIREWKDVRDTFAAGRTFNENRIGYAIRDMVQIAETMLQKEYSNDTDSSS